MLPHKRIAFEIQWQHGFNGGSTKQICSKTPANHNWTGYTGIDGTSIYREQAFNNVCEGRRQSLAVAQRAIHVEYVWTSFF